MLEADWFGHEESDSVSCHPEPNEVRTQDPVTEEPAPTNARNN